MKEGNINIKKKIIVILLILLVLPANSKADMAVTFIDVGQGDAILVDADGQCMMIDCGPLENIDAVLNCLAVNGVTLLDYLIGTHPHEDHIGGMTEIISSYDVNEIMMPKVLSTTWTFENLLKTIQDMGLMITTPVPGNIFTLGDAVVTVFAPINAEYDILNDYSIVLRVDYGDISFLFTGDIEEEAEDDILDSGADIDVDVMKVAHHGSRTSTNLSFLLAASPEIAVISCGLDNPYGHPEDLVLFRLTRTGVNVYRTDQDGDITITTDGKTISIETEVGAHEVYH